MILMKAVQVCVRKSGFRLRLIERALRQAARSEQIPPTDRALPRCRELRSTSSLFLQCLLGSARFELSKSRCAGLARNGHSGNAALLQVLFPLLRAVRR